jgi:hypothetical protein
MMYMKCVLWNTNFKIKMLEEYIEMNKNRFSSCNKERSDTYAKNKKI